MSNSNNCPQAPDRNTETGTGGTHDWVLYDKRQGQIMGRPDAKRSDYPNDAVYSSDLYKCRWCGAIEAF